MPKASKVGFKAFVIPADWKKKKKEKAKRRTNMVGMEEDRINRELFLEKLPTCMIKL